LGRINFKITQAVILAGGAGTRLQPFTLTKPKPLIPVNGKPFIEHLINLLKNNGIKEIILLTGYLGDKISQALGDGSKYGVKIKYSYTPFKDFSGEEIKSGTRLLNAHELLSNSFLLLYCDNYLPFNLRKLEESFVKSGCDLQVTVYSNKDSSTKNNIIVSEGLVKKYDRSRKSNNLSGVDIGFMVVKKEVLGLLPEKNCKFEDIVFPKLIKAGKLAGFITDQKYYSIGDMKRVRMTSRFLKPKRVVFLDRDGVINVKPSKADYVKKWEEFKFIPEAKMAIKKLTDSGYKIFVITNQPGIARRKMTLTDLQDVHKKMISEIKRTGGKIAGIYYCPHGWDEGCDCRKPEAGMLFRASRENLIDLTQTFFIGDDERDFLAGEKALTKTVLVKNGRALLKAVEKITGQI
jgi:histidinol-phosphate phosphatase family protein